MHYEISYDTTDAKAEAKALKDIKDFWGAKHFKKVTKALADDHGRSSKKMILISLSICGGVEGYPAHVLLEKYWTPQMRLDF
jgi:hypothetical protein